MEHVEFRVSPDGQVYYKEQGRSEKRLTKFSTAICEQLLATVKYRFPAAYSRLQTLYPRNTYDIVQRFVRCNFGEHDLLTPDIDHDILHFEEVRCPLRGMCPDEGIVCKPQSFVNLTAAESEVAHLYLDGYTFDEIAQKLGKSPATVKVQLHSIKQKTGARNCREIIKIMRLGNI